MTGGWVTRLSCMDCRACRRLVCILFDDIFRWGRCARSRTLEGESQCQASGLRIYGFCALWATVGPIFAHA